MKRYDQYYKRGAVAALILGICLMSGCAPSVDNKEDPLSNYTVDSLLPFDTSQVTSTQTPTPEPTPTPTISPVDQTWQNDNQVGQSGSTAAPQQVTQRVPFERLELGSTGEGVEQLQQRLIDLGYLSGTADGNYGSNTKTAVKRFQAALGLSQTGVATVTLQEKLFLSTAPTYSPSLDTSNGQSSNSNSASQSDSPYKTLIRGDKGDGVQQLQARLIALGYLSGSADGSFGTQTEAAVKRFQAALGLTQNGVASASLQQSLFSSNAPVAVATATPKATQAPTQAPTKKPESGTATGYVDLEYGDKGDAVKRLQQRLKELGYFTHTATGNYFSETEAAVKNFQAALGLTQTGVATASLQTKLFASNAPAYSPSATAAPTNAPVSEGKYTTLSRGSTGEEVRALQKRLIALGYLTGGADGDYGKGTESAVMLFQKSIGYNETGIATEAVQEYLFSPYAPTYSAPSVTNAPAQPTQAPAQSEYVELRYGDTGDAVKRLQQRLKDLGYFSGDIGGNYLTKTQTAVSLFESAIGWNPDGVATVVLQQYIFSAQAPAYDESLGYVSLEKGDSGDQVRELQQRLIDLGYLTGKADGDFGAKTQSAVAAFQASIGLSATGVADTDTQEYLFSANAPTAQPTTQPTIQPTQAPSGNGYQTLSYGVSGESVKNLQRRLKELGYFTGNVAGNYKDLTQSAVVAFQQAIGWTADGIATPELQEYLFSASAPAAGSGSGSTGGSSGSEGGTTGSYAPVSYGEKGSSVKQLQQRLIELGWLTGAADGDFGMDTLNAVTALQYRFGMEQTGIATAELQQRLYAADAPAYVEYEELSFGMMGEQVLALQVRLVELGYLRDTEANMDGEFGEGTRGAVINVQQAMGLTDEEVNGVATIEFQTFLFSDFALEYKIETN